VIAFSTCASNVATSFVSEPRTDLNADCTEDLEPNFVTQAEFDATVDTSGDDDAAPPATPEDDDDDESQVGPRG
jgi:hypothetical protein